MQDHDEISRLAYFIWESEGRPHGRHLKHWEMSKKLVAAVALARNLSSARMSHTPSLVPKQVVHQVGRNSSGHELSGGRRNESVNDLMSRLIGMPYPIQLA